MQDTILSTLKKHLNIIAELIIDKNDVFYIDIPLHFNVGDLLIYHGTEKFFLEHNIKIKLRESTPSFSIKKLKKEVTDKTTILCHGGGNFGDIYTNHHNIRETVIKHFPNNRVIILPQTVFFKGI